MSHSWVRLSLIERGLANSHSLLRWPSAGWWASHTFENMLVNCEVYLWYFSELLSKCYLDSTNTFCCDKSMVCARDSNSYAITGERRVNQWTIPEYLQESNNILELRVVLFDTLKYCLNDNRKYFEGTNHACRFFSMFPGEVTNMEELGKSCVGNYCKTWRDVTTTFYQVNIPWWCSGVKMKDTRKYVRHNEVCNNFSTYLFDKQRLAEENDCG